MDLKTSHFKITKNPFFILTFLKIWSEVPKSWDGLYSPLPPFLRKTHSEQILLSLSKLYINKQIISSSGVPSCITPHLRLGFATHLDRHHILFCKFFFSLFNIFAGLLQLTRLYFSSTSKRVVHNIFVPSVLYKCFQSSKVMVLAPLTP